MLTPLQPNRSHTLFKSTATAPMPMTSNSLYSTSDLLMTFVAAIFHAEYPALLSCTPTQTPSVHLSSQSLEWQILFVSVRSSVWHSQPVYHMSQTYQKDKEYEILCMSNKCQSSLVYCKLQCQSCHDKSFGVQYECFVHAIQYAFV